MVVTFFAFPVPEIRMETTALYDPSTKTYRILSSTARVTNEGKCPMSTPTTDAPSRFRESWHQYLTSPFTAVVMVGILNLLATAFLVTTTNDRIEDRLDLLEGMVCDPVCIDYSTAAPGEVAS